MSREHPTFCETCGKMDDGGDFFPDEIVECACSEREAITLRLFGVSADEFARQFKAGRYTGDHSDLMRVLMLFPELD